MSQSMCDKACEILQRTNDGDDLAPNHLWLVQEMVNGHLNERGEAGKEVVLLTDVAQKKEVQHG